MGSSVLFTNISEVEKNTAIDNIIQHAVPRQDFFLMLILSVGMAASGVLLESVVVLVGSMLIAPLLYPILSLSLGVIVVDEKLMRQSIFTILKSVGYAVLTGFIIGFLFSSHHVSTFALTVAGASASLIYALVAAIAGFAGAFAVTKPYLNETLPGVAISVSLVPPLAVAGVALSSFDWQIFADALLLFTVNVIGIIFSAMIVFALFNFGAKKTVAKESVKEGERIIQKEVSLAEKV